MTEHLEKFSKKMAGESARLYLFDELDSTNTFAKTLRGDRPAVVLAAHQTAGRGRMGRIWEAQLGDLCISFYYPSPLRDLLGLTLAAALAAVETIDHFCAGAGIKWPNDILLQEKKLVGILVESVFSGPELQAVVVGVGVNVNADHFPEELTEKANSLRIASGRETDAAELAFCLKQNMDRYFNAFCQKGFGPMLPLYTSRSIMLGKEVTVFGKRGICRGFSERGGILLQQGEGPLEEVYFGEASF